MKAANRLMSNVQKAIAAGIYVREDFFEGDKHSEPTTFAEYAEDWLKGWVKASSTKRTYETAFAATWNPYFGTKKLTELRQRDIRKAIAERAKVLKPGTLNNQLSALRVVLRAAVADKLIPDSPAAGVENLPIQRTEPDPFDAKERDAILAHMQAKYPEQVWNYYTLAFHTGLRPSEQIALVWGDIDWIKKKLKVERARVDGEEKPSTKTNRKRFVDLSDVAITALTRQKVHTFMKGGKIFENPYTNRPWNNEAQQRINFFTPTLKALGLRHRDAYQTRHSFASILLSGGIKPAYISKQLGHTSLAMLFQTYGRWLEAESDAEAQKLNEILSGVPLDTPQKPLELSTNCPRTAVNS
jgi:integrase